MIRREVGENPSINCSWMKRSGSAPALKRSQGKLTLAGRLGYHTSRWVQNGWNSIVYLPNDLRGFKSIFYRKVAIYKNTQQGARDTYVYSARGRKQPVPLKLARLKAVWSGSMEHMPPPLALGYTIPCWFSSGNLEEGQEGLGQTCHSLKWIGLTERKGKEQSWGEEKRRGLSSHPTIWAPSNTKLIPNLDFTTLPTAYMTYPPICLHRLYKPPSSTHHYKRCLCCWLNLAQHWLLPQ